MNVKQIVSSLLLLCIAVQLKAQHTDQNKTVAETGGSFSLSGYAEIYYGFDFNKPVNNTRPDFLYSHNRHNEVNINLAFLKGAYDNGRLRGNIALATGTYVNANYAPEPGVLKNIYEASAGIKILKKHQLWVDAGVMPSHIGFESAQTTNCLTLTRSMVADNSPYYEAGIKVGYTSKNDKWYLAALLLNGWQRIQRVDGNSTPAAGTQITYKPTEKITLNHSTYIGNDAPDPVRKMRIYNNLYAVIERNEKLTFIVGFDYGTEQISKGSSKRNDWFSPVVILHYKKTDKIAIVLRAEYFEDEKGVIIRTGIPQGFRTWGYSAGLNYDIFKNAAWRIEGKIYDSEFPIFNSSTGFRNSNSSLITALIVSL